MSYKLTVDAARMNLREAFDRHALTYDERFTSMKAAQAMRQEIWRIADRLFPPGSRLLDLGCGTGEDAMHYARKGVHVTAIDIAPGMITQLLRKSDAAGLTKHIDARVADIETYESEPAAFDGLLSNFGAVNCLKSVSQLRRLAARALKPAASVVLVTMGRLYPLETAVFLMKGNPRRAFARLQRQPEVTLEGIRVSCWYHSPRALRQGLGADFSLQQLRGLRSFTTSPALQHVERFLPSRLTRAMDRFTTSFPPTAAFADHYLTVWRYR